MKRINLRGLPDILFGGVGAPPYSRPIVVVYHQRG